MNCIGGVMQGRNQDFKLGVGVGGAHLKKLRRAEGDTNIFEVFRVKKITILRQKIIFFPNWRAPPLIPPVMVSVFVRA